MVDKWSGKVEDALEDVIIDEKNDGEDIFNMWKQMENRVYEDSTSFLNCKLYYSFFSCNIENKYINKALNFF